MAMRTDYSDETMTTKNRTLAQRVRLLFTLTFHGTRTWFAGARLSMSSANPTLPNFIPIMGQLADVLVIILSLRLHPN